MLVLTQQTSLSIINLAMIVGLILCSVMLVCDILKDCNKFLKWLGIDRCKLNKETRAAIESIINRTVDKFIEDYVPYYDNEYSLLLKDIVMDYDSGVEEEIKKMHLDKRIDECYVAKGRLYIKVKEEFAKQRWEEVSNEWNQKGMHERVKYHEQFQI